MMRLGTHYYYGSLEQWTAICSSYIQISAKDQLSIRAATFQITNVMNIMLVSVNEYTQEICWLNEL